MLTKQQVIENFQAIPEDKFTHLDFVIEELILMDKLERSLEEMRNGEVMSQEEVDKELGL